MADLAALKAAVDAAQAAKDGLKADRISNRNSMVKIDFQNYNHNTAGQQRAVQADMMAAEKAFNDELKVIRADATDKAIAVAVGTLSETNTPEGTN